MSELIPLADEGHELLQLHGAQLWYAIAIPALPIVASLLTFFFGKRMWRGGAALTIAALVGSLGLSLTFFVRMLGGADPIGWETTWFKVANLDFTVGFLLDNLAVWLMTLVSLLSLLIVVFSTAYLHDEKDAQLRRYYSVKALFVAGMLGSVVMDNYLLMFMFWEIMGLCSYLLIGYWYNKESASIAAKKAFLTTRLGDLFFFLGIVILFVTFHTFSYRELFHHPELLAHKGELFWAGLFIFFGAVGKSAQFPLDIWLPDAMEGPTTVSALIHAATMVKAGVYLVARSFPLYVAMGLGDGETMFLLIGTIGGITAIYTASMALAALDIKRVLAFSTLSQLGYMFLALGAGGYLYLHTGNGVGFTAAMLHLMNHAFFKALLFLGSASVILGMHHHQDLREMGGLRKKMPITFITMGIGTLSIAGFPFLSGFWSKDEVLHTAFDAGSHHTMFTLLWILGVTTALMTSFYMFRMMFLAFGDKPRTESAEHAHESPVVMTGPLVVLAVAAAVSGAWLILGNGFESYITYPYSHDLGEHHAVATGEILTGILTAWQTYVSIAAMAIGFVIARAKYGKGLPAAEASEPTTGMRRVLYRRYYVTEAIYEPLGNVLGAGIASVSAWFDRKGIDGAVNGIANRTDRASLSVRRLQDGRLSSYMATAAIGATILVGVVYLVIHLDWRWT